MKKYIFILIILLTCFVKAQTIGKTTTPYDTTGWDAPEDTTIHYGLPIYRLLSNPGGWINISQRQVDSLLWALVVYTKLPLYIENDTLKISWGASPTDSTQALSGELWFNPTTGQAHRKF